MKPASNETTRQYKQQTQKGKTTINYEQYSMFVFKKYSINKPKPKLHRLITNQDKPYFFRKKLRLGNK